MQNYQPVPVFGPPEDFQSTNSFRMSSNPNTNDAIPKTHQDFLVFADNNPNTASFSEKSHHNHNNNNNNNNNNNPTINFPADNNNNNNQESPVQVAAAAPKTAHPYACFFHAFFKVCAIVLFLILNLLTSASFVSIFIVTVLLTAFDFWTVKNVTGRLLVGLRWWNEILDDGSNHWRFESLEGQRSIQPLEAVIFWTFLVLYPIIWIVFSVFIILKPSSWEQLILIIVVIILSAANIVGYIKCARDAKNRAKSMAKQVATKIVIEQATNFLMEGANKIN